jgi:hypothetical protein
MIPYHTRRVLRRIFVSLVLLALVAAGVLLCWLLWLNRYVVYTRDGVELDFNMSLEFPQGELAVPPTAPPPVDIYYNEGENLITPENTELTQLSGLYITTDMLINGFDAVEKAVKTLPADIPVMVDVKNFRGEFFYSTQQPHRSEKVDTARVDNLISTLHKSGNYLIARLPALRDYWHGLENVNDGVFNPNRLSLWIDSDHCYWLNPSAEGTLNYLMAIVSELKAMGFDEVVFEDFCLPPTDAIYFEGDKVEAVNTAAANLVKICSTDTFAVSFSNADETFALPEGRSRLFLEGIAAADAAAIAQLKGFADPEIRLVFLTELKDTRFDAYGVMRPMDVE